MLILEPRLHEKIWGGTKLRDVYGYEIPSETTGECWAINGMKNEANIIVNGIYKGKTLLEVFKEQKELFGYVEFEEFPLLVKILDAKDKLSIQVHPNDEEAKRLEGYPYGKSECWYILDAGKTNKLVYGHNANSHEEMKNYIENDHWNQLLRIIEIRKGDFLNIPPGTIHAILEDTLIYEVQQSSDITYRFYDYDRLENGQKRELHIDKSIEVTNIPHNEKILEFKFKDNVTTLIESEYFSVYKTTVSRKQSFSFNKPFLCITILDGNGFINSEEVNKGMNLILTANETAFEVCGEFEMIISSI